MACISVDELKPGMVLARSAVDRNNRVLLAAGTTLTEDHIKIFRAWGVTEVSVEGRVPGPPETEAAAAADPERIREVRERLEERFRHVDLEDPVAREVFRLLAVRELGREGREEREDGPPS
ncbi:DUF3391 domain-containing protein [Dissulfurirhabdus thermomarina]|uniref:DUF3391 domain-containing protein n=1 Tax=Dissulfurirhabdus thermomarina TaxID=1765737 RepID=A0A6N9TNE2_DISTH|nr:DUF3391 domain-containing protein [Dissulfurirhabdus thermomarina]NDY41294.1 DUF3391 domain-containing protein [Dissulfurirhabdus thermomarina]NMX23751.1 DUF3391 domain-containing protein [Dissulfurirhabdus thermomarina]